MKIIFDIDGTLTDFNRFVDKYAVPFFNKLGIKQVNPDAVEIEQKMDFSRVEINERKKIVNRFWISYRFIWFSLFGKFRPGVRKSLNRLKNKGYDVYFYTSRDKTTEKNIIGVIARLFTKLQFINNGVIWANKKIRFFKNDDEKIKAVFEAEPDVVFDDKADIVMKISRKIPVICVRGRHNTCIEKCHKINILNSFMTEDVTEKFEELFGKRMEIYNRALYSEKFFRRLSPVNKLINIYFHPYVLHKNNIIQNNGVIYVSNHRSTLDPLVVESIIARNIHWAALARFFKAEDSIFNNNKNRILCQLTAWLFKRLELIPIERKRDNPNANNINAMRDMTAFLKAKEAVGIFPEGTTRRNAGDEFGTFDSSFFAIAKAGNGIIQPINILWGENKSKVVINFGRAFSVDNDSIEHKMYKFMRLQKRMLEENKRFFNKNGIAVDK